MTRTIDVAGVRSFSILLAISAFRGINRDKTPKIKIHFFAGPSYPLIITPHGKLCRFREEYRGEAHRD